MIVVFRAIRSLWYARLRHIDIKLLWPVCLKGASDLDHAKAAFAIHCFNDPAWLDLGEDRLFEFMDKLEAINPPTVYHQTTYSAGNDLPPDEPERRDQLLRPAPPTQGPSGLHRPQD